MEMHVLEISAQDQSMHTTGDNIRFTSSFLYPVGNMLLMPNSKTNTNVFLHAIWQLETGMSTGYGINV